MEILWKRGPGRKQIREPAPKRPFSRTPHQSFPSQVWVSALESLLYPPSAQQAEMLSFLCGDKKVLENVPRRQGANLRSHRWPL